MVLWGGCEDTTGSVREGDWVGGTGKGLCGGREDAVEEAMGRRIIWGRECRKRDICVRRADGGG